MRECDYEQVHLDNWIEDMKKGMDDGLLIAPFIPHGRKNAISRTELAIKMGVSDRAMRRMIEEDRQKVPIINTQGGGGYYRPTAEDRSELKYFIKQNVSRAASIWRWVRVAKRAYREL